MKRFNKKMAFSLCYAWVMVILALISICLIILDYAKMITLTDQPYSLINNVIWVIFVSDYCIRLVFADNKRAFLKANIFDLLSILPVSGLFTVFRISRITRLLRLLRIIRLIGMTGRLKHFLKINGLIYYLYVSCALLIISACLYSFAEHTNLENALWWSITTATTVGYGDMTPQTGLGRIAAIVLMLVGVGFVGMLTSSITNFFTNQDQNNLKKEIRSLHEENTKIMKKLTELQSMMEDDD